MNRLNLFFALLLISASFAFIPFQSEVDTEEIMQKIAQVYKTNPYIYHEIQYDLKRDLNSHEIHSSETGLYVKNKKSTYSKIGPVASLLTPDYVLGIDDDDKVVFLSDNTFDQQVDALSEIMSAWESKNRIRHEFQDDFTGVLNVEADAGEIKNISIFYDRSNYVVKKMILDYRRSIDLSLNGETDYEQPILEITYTNTSFEEMDLSVLQLEHYVNIRDASWSTTAAYADYEFINNLVLEPSK